MKIAIEGITKTGKSTLCQLLTSELKTSIELINLNEILNNELFLTSLKEITHPKKIDFNPLEELLLYSARLKRKDEIIKNITIQNPNSIILIDRHIHSIFAFFNGVRQIEISKIETLLFDILEISYPDITIFIDAEIDTIKVRIGNREVSRKNKDLELFFENYRNAFLSTISNYSKQTLVINGNDNIEIIKNRIKEILITAHNKGFGKSGADGLTMNFL